MKNKASGDYYEENGANLKCMKKIIALILELMK
jgi:hypothetical protein